MKKVELEYVLNESKKVIELLDIASCSKEGNIISESHDMRRHPDFWGVDKYTTLPYSEYKIMYNGEEESIMLGYKEGSKKNKDGKYDKSDIISAKFVNGKDVIWLCLEDGKIKKIQFSEKNGKTLVANKIEVNFDLNTGQIINIEEKTLDREGACKKMLRSSVKKLRKIEMKKSPITEDIGKAVLKHNLDLQKDKEGFVKAV